MKSAPGTSAKKQHYLPKLILRRFSTHGEGKQVWCFRKTEGRAILNSLDDAGSQNRWNQFELPNGEMLENAFQRVEDVAARGLDRVIKTESVRILTRAERVDVALFVVLQMLRTPGFRNFLQQHDSALGTMLGESGRQFTGYMPLSREELRNVQCTFVARRAGELVPAVLNKVWVLQKPAEGRFIIGDSPVVRRHMLGDFGSQQWMPGLEARGAEIYLPLSPKLTLAMWCRSLPVFDRRRRAIVAGAGRFAPAPAVPAIALRGDRPHLIGPPTVWHLNHMQLQMAHQYVYAGEDCFDDLREMIRKDERLAHPPEMIIEPDSIFKGVAHSASSDGGGEGALRSK